MQDMMARIAELEAQNKKAHETIYQLQMMFENHSKQKLDGFKYELTNDLERTVKDAKSDFSELTDREKAEVYKALLEDMVDILEHNGIVIE